MSKVIALMWYAMCQPWIGGDVIELAIAGGATYASGSKSFTYGVRVCGSPYDPRNGEHRRIDCKNQSQYCCSNRADCEAGATNERVRVGTAEEKGANRIGAASPEMRQASGAPPLPEPKGEEPPLPEPKGEKLPLPEPRGEEPSLPEPRGEKPGGAVASGAQRGGAAASGAQRGGAAASGAQRGGAAASGAQRGGAAASGAQRGGAVASGAQRGGAAASGAQRGGAAASGAQRGGAAASGAQRGEAAASRAQTGEAATSGAHRGGEEHNSTTAPTTTPTVQSGVAASGPSPLAPGHPVGWPGPPFTKPRAQESAEAFTVLQLVPCSAPPGH
ncbi:UNVERIFIED_CONTAM: hypothetical protein FKN15_011659 [Acipenser sinensis]